MLDKLMVTGGNRLTGEVIMSGAKNAVITIIPAAIVADNICRIENIPNITDVTAVTRILYGMGAKIREISSSTIEIDPRPIHTCVVSHELARHIRGSYYLLGALLGRLRHAVVSIPGGYNLGVHPIGQHLRGFGTLNVTYALEGSMVDVSAEGLIGNNIYVDVVSVGTTVNIMLVVVRAKGTTVIGNAAKEPHIVDLANFSNSMGTDVRGTSTDVIKIYGVEHLKGTTYSIIPDQIEAGTYMTAAAATSGDVPIKNVTPKHLESIFTKLEKMGVTAEGYDDSTRIKRNQSLNRCNIETMPHPGFPTDMRPQIAVVLSIAHGTNIISENVWDSRFRYAKELKRMSAQISVGGELAAVEGVGHLNVAPVRVTDLRAGAAVLIVALCAHGISQVEDTQYIKCGYGGVEKKLLALGADVKRVHVPDPSVAQTV